jgi:hypothetical protein
MSTAIVKDNRVFVQQNKYTDVLTGAEDGTSKRRSHEFSEASPAAIAMARPFCYCESVARL